MNIIGELSNGQKKDENSTKLKINHVQSCTTNSLYYELLDFFKLVSKFMTFSDFILFYFFQKRKKKIVQKNIQSVSQSLAHIKKDSHIYKKKIK